MDLNLLAPNIQDEILLTLQNACGQQLITERDIRLIAAKLNWKEQRQVFGQLAETRIRPQ